MVSGLGLKSADFRVKGPHFFNRKTPEGQMAWVERVSLGKCDRSRSKTLYPLSANNRAVLDPAQRAPTTMTSCMTQDLFRPDFRDVSGTTLVDFGDSPMTRGCEVLFRKITVLYDARQTNRADKEAESRQRPFPFTESFHLRDILFDHLQRFENFGLRKTTSSSS